MGTASRVSARDSPGISLGVPLEAQGDGFLPSNSLGHAVLAVHIQCTNPEALLPYDVPLLPGKECVKRVKATFP